MPDTVDAFGIMPTKRNLRVSVANGDDAITAIAFQKRQLIHQLVQILE